MVLSYFIQTPDGSQLCCEETSILGLRAFVQNQLGIPEELQKFHLGGKPLTVDQQISELCTITLFLGLQGGKGGFGSLLKNQAQTRRKIINWDQSRDREGRRIINFKNENNLIDYYMNKQDEQKKIQEEKKQVEIQQATVKANENHIKLDQAYVRKNQQNEKIIENSIKSAIASKQLRMEKKIKQKKVNLDFMDEIDQFINEPEPEKKVKVYHHSQEEKKYTQLFEAYFDPFIEDKKFTYLRILKMNKSVKFATRAFVFTAPIFIGLYFLPGNQFRIQIEIKKFVRRSILQFYKFMNDYSENTYKETCQRNYIMALNNSYYYFEDQEILCEGQFQEIIEQYILMLNENPKLIEFALLHVDQLFAKILENHRYHYFVENSSLLIDLLDMIKICLPKIEQKELELKYQFETMKMQPITTLICALFQYSQNQSERVEIYKYAIEILAKSSVVCSQLKNQLNLLLPIIYRDLAKQDDQLNISAIKFLIEWQKSLQQSDVISALLKDQLYSNLFSVLNRKSDTFKQQFKTLLEITAQNKEICYLLKETVAFQQEKERLKITKVTKEFESIVKQLIQ